MRLKILAFVLFSTNILFPQRGAFETANLQQSPLLIGAGSIGAAIPNDDVLGFYFNPAILGYSARNNNISFSTMPTETDWFTQDYYYVHPASSSYYDLFLSNNYKEPSFNNFGFNFGYNLNTTKLKLPVTVGLGYLNNSFEYGNVSYGTWDESVRKEQEKGNNYDKFNSFSLGLGIDYFVKFNIGLSLKTFESTLSPLYYFPQSYTADGTIMDYGVLLIVQISELILHKEKFKYDGNLKLKPITNFSLGFSSSNHGDKIYYFDKSQKDPLSRTARLGYTFEFGLDLILEKSSINFFKYSFTAEAEDLLIEYKNTDMYNGTKYQGGIGDIDWRDHLFFLIADEKVAVHKGHILKFFDTLTLTFGSFDGKFIRTPNKSSGIGFSSRGIFNLLNSNTNNKIIKYITKHFEIEYFTADYEISYMPYAQNNNVNFDALSVRFVGFEF